MATKIFVVNTPKSGSSFIVTFLQNVTGYEHRNPVFPGEAMLEADPYPPNLDANPQPAVSQLHCHAKPKTLALCNQLSIRPIFITRNIFDSLLSWKEYIDVRPGHRAIFPHYYELGTGESRKEFLINVYAPIFIRMVAGWHEAFKAQSAPVMWCTYETFFSDQGTMASRMLDHLGLNHSNQQIEAALLAAQEKPDVTKLNKGVPDRGAAAFTAAERARVLGLIDSFKGFDAKAAGILS